MANKKISQLTLGGKLLSGDLIPVARNGSNFSVSGADLLNSIEVFPTGGTKGQILRLGDNGALMWTKEADQVTGLPYRFTGPGKFQYWRVGISSQSSAYTNISEIVLSNGPTGTMPTIANRTNNWPVQWTDGNPGSSERIFPNGVNVVETFDFGTAVTLDYFRFSGDYSYYSIKVEYSADQVNWSTAYSATPEANGGGIPFVTPLSVVLDTYLTTYNLTADPTKNVGKLLKVNAAGTGFDFAPGGMAYVNTKYRYYRIGLASYKADYTWMYNVDLRTFNDAIPAYTSASGSWPSAWTDGNVSTEAYIQSNQQFLYHNFDYGVPVSITSLTVTSGSNPALGTRYKILVSNNGTDFTEVTSGTFFHTVDFLDNPSANYPSGGVANQFQRVSFVAPGIVGSIGYNLSDDPTANIGRVLKVNADATGFDFIDLGAGVKGDKGDKGEQGIQGIPGPAGPAGSGSGSGSAKVKIYLSTVTLDTIGPNETEAYSVTFTPRVGSTLDINIGGIRPVVISSPTSPGSGYSQIETKVYRNGVLLTNQTSMETITGLPLNGNFVEENASGDPITIRVTKQYAFYSSTKAFSRYDTITGSFSYSYKIIDYP